MSNTRIELTLETKSGLTEGAIESMYREQLSDDLTSIEVERI